MSATLDRAQLEARLMALALIHGAFADDVDETRLSPAANTLLDLIDEYRAAARADLVAIARALGDEYVVRLAERTTRLLVPEVLAWSPETIVALVNKLPAIRHATRRAA